MRASPFEPLHIDLIFNHLCPYLGVRELGRLMAVNKLFWETFIVDQAWQHFYSRLVLKMPTLREHVFGAYPWVSSGEGKIAEGDFAEGVAREEDEDHAAPRRDPKRAKFAKNKGKAQKKPLIMPRGGYWYVMRHFIVPACSLEGIKKLCSVTTKPHFYDERYPERWTCRDRTVWYLLQAVFTFVIPAELVLECTGCRIRRDSRIWFTVFFRTKEYDYRQIYLCHGSIATLSTTFVVNSNYYFTILAPLRQMVLDASSYMILSPKRNFYLV